ncbi:6-bladed beta-propeller [uncultured Bacteroides sp.]|uniref:6-bladed beta-propeller n=1 Tax=uncultured Bacteroides sp. TaxID=162156 RepID=UPI00261210BF|nr:6-bladed beta-propeller [uncultured Bacteroides sp.]
MKYIKKLMFLLLPCVIESCISNSDTEIYQKKRDNIVDVHALIKEIPINDVLIGSIARPFLLGDYLLIGDYKSSDKLIHIFDKNNFDYLVSTADVGQGPNEITVMGHIGINEGKHCFYVSDHGKQRIYSYNIDSVLVDSDYTPTVKAEMNMIRFPDRYQYINDTLSFALMIEPTSASTFNQSVAKWNIQLGEFKTMKYRHPDITKKRISFAVSPENGIYVECYANHDLLSICKVDGNLKYNIYGPDWDKESTKIHHYGNVVFCNDKIIASYSGGDSRTNAYRPTRFLVFSLDGDYLKTLDVGFRIVDFCYDNNNNRIIMNFNDEIQFGYLDLNGIV